MRRFAQALDLRDDPDLIERYLAHHRAVWPEVVAGLRALGIRGMRIHRVGTRLCMTYEAPDDFDPRRDFQRYAESPRCAEWDALMRSFQQPIPGADPGAWWTPMECIFDLDEA